MSFNIDQIRKKEILETPETVNTSWSSPSWSIDDRFGSFSIQVRYSNGTAPNIKAYIQMCNTDLDGDFASIIESEAQISTPTGNVFYDLDGSGGSYIRIRLEVTSGSIDVTDIIYVAQQAH